MKWIKLSERKPGSGSNLKPFHLRHSGSKKRFVYEQYNGDCIWGYEVGTHHVQQYPLSAVEWLDEDYTEKFSDREEFLKELGEALDLIYALASERYHETTMEFDGMLNEGTLPTVTLKVRIGK